MNIDLFKKIIETNSIYPGEAQLADFLYEYLGELGFSTRKQFISEEFCENSLDGSRYNVIGEKGDGDKELVFYAHMDTVPVHDKNIWKTQPLKFTIDSDKKHIAYGLGVADMKGGLFSILEAVKNKDPKDYKLKVVFGVDEECWSKGGHTLSQSDELKNSHLVIVPELGDPHNVSYGTKNIILGRRGRVIVKLTVPGKSCHGANAESFGINAITQASIIAQEIDNNHQSTQPHPRLPDGNQFVKHFHSTVSSLSVPDLATLYIDRHTVPGENIDDILSEIQSIISSLYGSGKLQKIEGQEVGIGLYDRPTPIPEAYEVDVDNTYVDLVKDSIEKNNLKHRISYGYSVADENLIANIGEVPVITLGPDGGNEHGANEWVDLNSIDDLIKIYEDIINNFMKY